MESHPCEKNRGEGVPGALPVPNPDPYPSPRRKMGPPWGAESLTTDELSGGNEVRCQHVDARGHRCRMFVAPAEKTLGSDPDRDLADLTSDLYAHHAQRLLRRHRTGQTVGAELLASITDLPTQPRSIASSATSPRWSPSGDSPPRRGRPGLYLSAHPE